MKSLFKALMLLCIPGAAMSEMHAQSLCCCDLETAVVHQMREYPESRLLDIYKNFFQGEFGPGHIISNPEAAMNYIDEELEQTGSEPLIAFYEPVGNCGRFYRVDLAAVKSGRITKEQLLDALIESASIPVSTTVEQWKEKWQKIEDIVKEKYPDICNYENDSAYIANLLSNGKYVVHHSRWFELVYSPHYRLIDANIFETRLLPLIEPDMRHEEICHNHR